MFIPKKVLAISPHADDIELGVGGTLLKYKNQYDTSIHVFLCSAKTEAMLSNGVVTQDTRLQEFKCSMELLEADFRVSDSASTDLDTNSRSSLVGELDEYLEEIKPDCVFIPVPSFHQEHQLVHDCSIAACRPTKTLKPKTIFAYEYPAANWGVSAGYNPAFGGVYSNIDLYIEGKLELLKCHRSQNFHKNGLVSFDSVEALAKMRGYESGSAYAELLYLLRGYY